MGRPPVGDRAMTAAERQRRHREQIKQAEAVITENAIRAGMRDEIG